jgi:protein-disulfide isomerase
MERNPMKMLASLLVLPLALAGCSKEAGTPTAPASPAAAVAAPAGQSWAETAARTAEGTIVGNPNAPIKLVEYGSRLCPTCGALAREGFAPLLDKYVKTGKVSFEYREFLVHGAPDLPPALLGNCTDPSTFFPILEQMYQAQEGFNTKLQAMPQPVQQQLQTAKPVDAIRIMAEQMGLVDFAKQRGIPEAKARTCLADMKQIDRWTKQTQDKSADGTVTGTPTLILNGKKIDALSWGQLEPLLKAAGCRL